MFTSVANESIYRCTDVSLMCRCGRFYTSSLPLHLTYEFYMKRAEKPEGYRQMRPKTFPASNCSGNSQQMLQEIRESLRNLSRPSDAIKADMNAAKGSLDDPRQQGRSTNPKNPHHRALQEIRESLMPFAINKRMLKELQDAGFDEVCQMAENAERVNSNVSDPSFVLRMFSAVT